MNELMIFKNEEFGQIRTVEIDANSILLEKILRIPLDIVIQEMLFQDIAKVS